MTLEMRTLVRMVTQVLVVSVLVLFSVRRCAFTVSFTTLNETCRKRIYLCLIGLLSGTAAEQVR